MRPVKAAVLVTCLGSASLAQQPLSAIDWLDEAVTTPLTQALPSEPPVSKTALSPDVTVAPLDEASPDAAGLLPTSTTGLPKSLWSASTTDDLVDRLTQLSPTPLPAIQALYYTLLLAEADAPLGADRGARLLSARVQALTEFGAVEPARALLEHAGPAQFALFDEWLDLALLSGTEDAACDLLRKQPALSERYAARIYCTARAGDWPTAALTYETAVALDYLTDTEADLLAQYLDPETIHETAEIIPPKTMTPLVFRLFEAVGSPLPTRRLPRAFAMADLRDTTGWRSEIEAAERLASTGALPANHLLGLYTERQPAASGGVWDRVYAIQRLDHAFASGQPSEVSKALPEAWSAMKTRGLEVVFAQLFATPLHTAELELQIRDLAFLITLLSPDYETSSDLLDAPNSHQRFLIGLAQGNPSPDLAATGPERAVAAAFTSGTPPPAFQAMLDAGKLGETILAAAIQFDQTSTGNLSDITNALSTLRSVGLEDVARRAALQLLILGRDR